MVVGFANVTEIPIESLLADLNLVPEQWRLTVRNNGLLLPLPFSFLLEPTVIAVWVE